MFEGTGWFSYDFACTVLFFLLNIVFLVMPFAKKPTLIAYPLLNVLLYTIAIVLEIIYDAAIFDHGFQLEVIFMLVSTLLYQFSLTWFAFEMTEDNRLHIYSRIFGFLIGVFDFFIGIDYLENLGEECSDDFFDDDDDAGIDDSAKCKTLI